MSRRSTRAAWGTSRCAHTGTSMGEITCVIADDHPAILAAARSALEEAGIEVLGEAADGEAAATLVEHHRPTVALIDLRLGSGMTGIEVARRLGRSTPETATVMFTSYGDRALLVEALDAGVRGYVLKGAPLEELIRALRLVAEGGRYVDGALAPILDDPTTLAGAPQLTTREREVLRLLAEGLHNEEVGRRLYISPETVKVHVAKAMRKLESDTRTQAVAEALRRSIIS